MKVRVLGYENRILDAGKEKTLAGVLLSNGIKVPMYCGGNGTCNKCMVRAYDDKGNDLGAFRACKKEIDDFDTDITVRPLWQDEEHMTVVALDKGVCQLSQKDTTTMRDIDDGTINSAGIAIDIGTTTIAVSMVDLDKKKVVDTVTCINHQRILGSDVISRIDASNNGKNEELLTLIRKDLNECIKNLAGESVTISKAVISGNTTMLHLLMGYSCENLGSFPFESDYLGGGIYDAKRVFGEDVPTRAMGAVVTILPGASVFVGADIVSGLYECGFLDKEQEGKVRLFVDLGTNGEMAISDGKRFLVTSTAAGPAFEGGNISCGTGSIPGAISQVTIPGSRPYVRTIDGKNAIGICGTGVVEAVAELRRCNIIDASGRMIDEYFDDGYELAGGVFFTGKDVRQFQLAKAAVRAGIEVLLREFNAAETDVERVYIAGGFGCYLNLEKAAFVGIIPTELEKKSLSVGNTSLKGAIAALIDENCIDKMKAIAENAKEISLANVDYFNELYMENMGL